MKMKSVVLLVVAVGCGLVAMLGVQQVLSGNKSDEAAVAMVLVATADIIPGTPLNEENTVFKEMPRETIPEGAVTDAAQFADKSLKSSAVPGEFIMLAKLTNEMGASNEIPKGMRVVTTSVNLTKTHSGLIRAGDRVDILLSYKVRSPDRGMMAKTMTILEFIEVFATDSILSNQDMADTSEINAKNLSFLVTPQQASILKLAESKGDLNLSLRHKHDEEHVDVGSYDETFLDDKDGSSFGESNDEEEDERGPMLSDSEEGGDVRSAIAGELAQPAANPDADVEPVEPEIPMWTVTVYAGDEIEEQEVPLPLDENGMTEEEAALAEREAQLAEREADLNAREAEMDKKSSSAAGGVEENNAGPALESTKQSDEPVKAKDEKSESVLQGVLKRFLTGA